MYCGWGSGFIHGNSSRALLHPPANNSWYAYAYRHCTGTKLFICTPPPSRFWSSSAAPLLLLLHLQHSLLRLFKNSTNVELHYLFNPTFTTVYIWTLLIDAKTFELIDSMRLISH